METFGLEIEQEITLGDLANTIGTVYVPVDEILEGETASLNNFDGNEGIIVYFDVISESEVYHDEDSDYFNGLNILLGITSIYQS